VAGTGKYENGGGREDAKVEAPLLFNVKDLIM